MTDPDNAFGYELKESGEEGLIGAWLNQNRSLDRPFVFLDAGANRGDWTTCLMGQAQIDVVGHCFEPSPTMFKRLTDRVAEASTPHTNVQCYNVGLSDEEGTFPMRIFPGYEGVNSFLTDSGFWDSTYVDSRIIEAATTTGDAFCSRHGIDHIDMLKIDTEGFEWKVLHGFDSMLTNQSIDVIQFEYGYVTCNLHVTIKDFYAYLNTYQYRLGRLRSGGIDWSPFVYKDNDYFRTPNWVAFSPRAMKDL